MNWLDIWKIVVTAIMSLGGVGVIIYGIIKTISYLRKINIKNITLTAR
jgi:regulator of RNase E activity RraA